MTARIVAELGNSLAVVQYADGKRGLHQWHTDVVGGRYLGKPHKSEDVNNYFALLLAAIPEQREPEAPSCPSCGRDMAGALCLPCAVNRFNEPRPAGDSVEREIEAQDQTEAPERSGHAVTEEAVSGPIPEAARCGATTPGGKRACILARGHGGDWHDDGAANWRVKDGPAAACESAGTRTSEEGWHSWCREGKHYRVDQSGRVEGWRPDQLDWLPYSSASPIAMEAFRLAGLSREQAQRIEALSATDEDWRNRVAELKDRVAELEAWGKKALLQINHAAVYHACRECIAGRVASAPAALREGKS